MFVRIALKAWLNQSLFILEKWGMGIGAYVRGVTKSLLLLPALSLPGIVGIGTGGVKVLGLVVLVDGGGNCVRLWPSARDPSLPPDGTGGSVGITNGIPSLRPLGVKVIQPPSSIVGITIGPTSPPEMLGVKAIRPPPGGMVGITTGPTPLSAIIGRLPQVCHLPGHS